MNNFTLSFCVMILGIWSVGDLKGAFCQVPSYEKKAKDDLMIRVDSDTAISVYRSNGKQLVLRQVAKTSERPYIHPIYSTDGRTEITEFRPTHHIHQTGLYWGLKKVNGRDYFMNGRSDYWKRVYMKVISSAGSEVQWQTVYSLLDSTGQVIMEEQQNWAVQYRDSRYMLDFKWKGTAKVNVHMGKFYVGGLFVRMPWRKNRPSAAINSAGQVDKQAEGQRAEWFDVGIQLNDRPDAIHVTVLDHPANQSFPTPWRIDGEFGFGPSRQIIEEWDIKQGETETIRYRIMVFEGDFNQPFTQKESNAYKAISKP